MKRVCVMQSTSMYDRWNEIKQRPLNDVVIESRRVETDLIERESEIGEGTSLNFLERIHKTQRIR